MYSAVYNVADLVIPLPISHEPIVLSTKGTLVTAPRRKPAEPDFDSLIELITTTIAPESWEEVGGPGSIADFPTTLSLVVSQTQGVHKQIVDLLDQVRRLQDIQVVMEIKRIRLSRRQLGRLGITKDVHGRTTLSAAQRELLCQFFAKTADAHRLPSPKITLFNGQTVKLIAATSDTKHGKPTVLHVTPVAATDQKSVRLTVGEKLPNKPMKEAPHSIDVGQALLVDIVDFDRNADTMTFVLITPQVVVAEEERAYR